MIMIKYTLIDKLKELIDCEVCLYYFDPELKIPEYTYRSGEEALQ